jgi:hypothetical protein
MNKIKFLSEKRIALNGKVYKPVLIGDIPNKFGYKYITDYNDQGEEIFVKGINEWFNFKGFTYVKA